MLGAKLILLLAVFLRLLSSFRYFQQSFYKIKGYLAFFFKYSYTLLVPILAGLALINTDSTLNFIFALMILLHELSLLKIYKVGIKATPRFKRLCFLSLILFPLIFFYPYLYGLLNLLVVPLFIISNCLEKIINHKYLKRAVYKRNKFKKDVIGITGSYGKTTTKLYLAHILDLKKPFYTTKSYNTPMGISLAINQDNLELYDCLILEMGATKLNDIKYLAAHFRPNIAIVTEIGAMHLNSFKKIENIAKEKMELVMSLPKDGIAILNYDNLYIKNYPLNEDIKLLSFGKTDAIYCYQLMDNDSFKVKVKDEKEYQFKHNNLSEMDISNLMPALILAFHYGLDHGYIQKQILTLKKPKSRQSVITYKDITIIDDSFNSNLSGALKALEKLATYSGKKYLITPGFVCSNAIMDASHKVYAKKIAQVCDVVYVINCPTGRNLYKYLHKAYLISDYKLAFQLFNIVEGKRALLIENDLPDIYEDI